jgi:FtsP/CotA-like multicopper oxidase with cupredoxin domain
MRATTLSRDLAWRQLALAAGTAALVALAATARGEVDGIEGSSFQLTASDGYVSTPDGASIYSWGYANGSGAMQFPGPTLIVNAGATVTVQLRNRLPPAAGNVSIVFQGHDAAATGGVEGLLAREAPPGGSVGYTFTAGKPGTYLYSSGTRADLQVEMGLAGALIVRPTDAGCAYDNAATCFDRENLYVLGEMDLDIHRAVEGQVGGAGPIAVPTSPYDPEYWFINGRCAPDTMAAPGTTVLAHQPYNAITRMYPGERLLLRIVGAGRQMHPFHTHGNHTRLIARDGQLIAKASGELMGPLLFTISSIPGGTADAVFEWTGKDLGWDIYGAPHVNGPNTCTAGPDGHDAVSHEWCGDHGRAIPVQLPELQQLTFGGFWSGSPYLGVLGSLPPGEGGLNPEAGFTFMWHSHSEREIVNNDIFPGGMMTMLVIEARP